MNKKKSFFLWPKPKLYKSFFYGLNFTSTEKIEEKLFEMFPSGYPVLCSSGRSAIYLILQNLNLQRKNCIGVFPFASHCVINTISRITTPIFGSESLLMNYKIKYHQWGYVQESDFNENTIEDCVDTLCKKGTKLFPGGGSYEIWSLPKIFGITSGSILWCKNKIDSEKIKNLRDNKKHGFSQWLLRVFSYFQPALYDYWDAREYKTGRTSIFQNGEIMFIINNWDLYVTDRLNKINILWKYSLDYLEKPTNRLPSVIPIHSNLNDNEIVSIGLSAANRYFEKIDKNKNRSFIKTIPFPINNEISETDIYKILNQIKKNQNSHGNT